MRQQATRPRPLLDRAPLEIRSLSGTRRASHVLDRISPKKDEKNMSTDTRKTIAVIGATGQQGGSVVRALQASGEFRVRALTRHPRKHAGRTDEVIEADMTRPETLPGALDGAYGVFVVTNFWEPGTNEITQAQAVIEAAKTAGVQHFVWSTLPNVEV